MIPMANLNHFRPAAGLYLAKYGRFFLLLGWLLVGAGAYSACQSPMSDYRTEKFKLSASPAAPDGYQMVIFEGDFHRSDGETFPVPSGHRLISGWRGSSISWAVGDERQPAPDSLHLLWYSTVEDKFYEGRFLLPQQRIYSLLKAGYWNTEQQVAETYDELTVLVGPKGLVVVWLAGGKNKVLIGHFRGVPTTSQFPNETAQEHAATLREERAALPPAVQQQIAAGTISSKQWDDYLRTYSWQVAFNQPVKLYDYGLDFLNAERTNYPPTRNLAPYAQALLTAGARAVPASMSLFIETEAGHRYEIRVVAFDEAETMAAFEQLHKTAPEAPITLTVELDKPLQRAQLLLQSQGQRLPLTKTKVEVFGAK